MTILIIIGATILGLGALRGLALNEKEKRDVEITNARYLKGGDLRRPQ